MAAPQHILIVEDNHALRESLAEVLRGRGFTVTAVDCAEELAERPPVRHDIAILDLNLPGEDGLSLATRLRRAQPGMGIILLTVRNAVADRLAGYDSGADLYLPKPIDPEELLAALDALRRRLSPTQAHPELPTLDWSAAALRTEHGVLALRDTEDTETSSGAGSSETKKPGADLKTTDNPSSSSPAAADKDRIKQDLLSSKKQLDQKSAEKKN